MIFGDQHVCLSPPPPNLLPPSPLSPRYTFLRPGEPTCRERCAVSRVLYPRIDKLPRFEDRLSTLGRATGLYQSRQKFNHVAGGN